MVILFILSECIRLKFALQSVFMLSVCYFQVVCFKIRTKKHHPQQPTKGPGELEVGGNAYFKLSL